MKRRTFLKSITAASAGSSIPLSLAAETKPNIIFIMSDDHTSQAVGAYGSRLAELNPTPNIDRLAKEGVLLENAFCTNSICTPSRACIMTGQYNALNGVTDLGGRLPKERQFLALEMKKAGYLTAVIGKWHLKERPDAFDYYKVLPGQGDYFDPVFYEKGCTEKTVKKKKGKDVVYKGAVKMNGHSSDCITDSVLAWLKKRNKTKPFFLKYHFKAPHDMFEYAKRYESYLADTEIPEPDNLWKIGNHGSIATRGHNDELRFAIGTSISPRNTRRSYKKWGQEGKNDKEITHLAYQSYLKRYLRCVKGVDDNLKRVFDYLKQEGLFDNTVIMYTGDQGFYLGEHDYMDKRWGYEEGMRMPFLVRYPKTIKPNSRTDAIVENVDYGPTMLDFAGVKTPGYMQGRSFKSILESGKEPKDWKKAAYYHYWMHMAHHDNPGHIGIRTKQYKLLFFYGAGEKESSAQTPPGWELYDLKKDPEEMNNVYDNPEYKNVVRQLKAELKELRIKYKEDDPKYACNKVIDEFWDYDDKARAKAIDISKKYLEQRKKSVKRPKNKNKKRKKK